MDASSNPRGIELVWLKRDLRLCDHAAFSKAARSGPCVAIFVYEPELLAHPTTDASHLAFIAESLRALQTELTRIGGRLITRTGNLPEVFDRLHRERPIARLWSHEETGLGITYARDRRVKGWARHAGVHWIELPNHGVFRPHPRRDGWAARWRSRMAEPIRPAPERIIGVDALASDGIRTPQQLGLGPSRRTQAATGGMETAHSVLASFLAVRSRGYQGDISSPLTAWESGSRLSPYLAWGNLSVRQVYQATRERSDSLRGGARASDPAWSRSLHAFAKRLHWHCHFIQKLEDEPAIEHANMSRTCDGLRDERPDEALLGPWRTGHTGYPMVDACMRALQVGGWINFRMRAMLMSFASYHLWQHWREPALHLARLFLDFEPGIHFPQAQMQSGTTGINAVRIYSPVKQVRDQDPEGRFIRRWCPELARVPDSYLPRPETMPLPLQRQTGCLIGRDYPAPIVDNGQAYMAARRRMQRLRAGAQARSEAADIFRRHGSRKRARAAG